MNALAVGTPASTIAGSSASGSSIPPSTVGLSAKSTALSAAVTRRNSSIPARIERWAAGDDPVPGLLKARKVVVPPNAAAERVLEEPVGLVVGGHPGVGVDVDAARAGRAAHRVDDLARGGGQRR